MAPSATNGDALAALDEIRAPAGVVIPPKEIKGTFPHPVLRETEIVNKKYSYPREDRWICGAKWHSVRRYVSTLFGA
jgi:hypothetical protein